ncbi:MAG: hypothetical protein WKF64_08490, partial [Ilumatobacteraceae bacterium]
SCLHCSRKGSSVPILDLQRRLREAGRIRIGVQAPIANRPGKTRPAKLSTFRLTSQDQTAVVAAAELFGGTPQRWEGAPVGEQWEVITDTAVMPVVVPPAATVFSQWYELWSGGGCQRRCDGQTEMLSEQGCLCALEDERTCTPHTRLNMILRDLPGIGVWRLETQGWYAATELAGTVEVIAAAATRGQLLPAVLRLEERQVKRAGEQTKKFAVPVLDIAVTPTALGLVVGTAAPLPPASAGALPAAGETWQPIPAPAELGPATDVGDAIRNPATAGPKKTKRTAPELPPTGLNPRGAPTEEPPPPPPPDDTEPGPPTISRPQMQKVQALYSEIGVRDAGDKQHLAALVLGVESITSHKDLTVAQAGTLIEHLDAISNGHLELVCDDEGVVTGLVHTQPNTTDQEDTTS